MRKASGLLVIFTLLLPLLFQQTLLAQQSGSKELNLKNTIHYNVTNPMIFGNRSIIFGYERVLNKLRSFTLNIGTTDFPKLGLVKSDSVKLKSVTHEVGFHLSADYRFYLAKQNKYAAPRGVYIGPYYSYNYFKNNATWLVKPTNSSSYTEVKNEMKLNVHTIGFEMGYQFVFWDRLSVDLILIGPGIGLYSLRSALGTNLSDADKQKLREAINESLEDRFPGYTIVIEEDD